MLGYGARVYYPPEDNPNEGGGPIRRSPLVTTHSGDGMQPHGYPQMVLRTPHNVVYDTEPGGAFLPELWSMKFLPDGRVVPAGALGAAGGGGETLAALTAIALGGAAGVALGLLLRRTA